MELDPQVCPEKIMSREVQLGCESWTSFVSGFPQQQCNGHCLCDSAQARQLKQQLRSALVAAQWQGDTALNTSIVLAAVHGLSGLFRTVSAVEPSLYRPLPTLSPSLIGHLASVDVKQHERIQNHIV